VAPRQERLSALQEELVSIEFALQELDEAVQEGEPDAEGRELVRNRLSDRLDQRQRELMRLYSSLPSAQAVARLKGFLELHPANVHAHLELARVLQRAGHLPAAVDEYVLAIVLDPASVEPHLRLAELYERMARKAEALYEYRTYVAMEPDASRRPAAERRVASLEEEVVPGRGEREERGIEGTPQRLEYLRSTLQELETDPGLERRTLQQLAGRFARWLDTPTIPPAPEPAVTPVAPPAGEEPERRWEMQHIQRMLGDVAHLAGTVMPRGSAEQIRLRLEARHEELFERAGAGDTPEREPSDADYAAYARAQIRRFAREGLIDESARYALLDAVLDRRPAAVGAPIAAAPAAPPAPPPEPPAPPPVPREPFDWAAFWGGVFSERTMTAVLGFGVLLVAVSSVALLASQWNVYSWPVKQAFVLVQFAVFLAAGHMFKERFKLHLSGLALITIAALWVPLNVGTGVFELVPVPDPHFAPGFRIALNLPVWGWLIIAASPVPVWALLALRYRGHLLAHGTVAAGVATVILALRALHVDWEWSGASAAVLATLVLLAWRYLRLTSLRSMVEPFFWTAQAILLMTAAVLLGVWLAGAGVAGTYPLALVGVAGAGFYYLANRFSPNLAYQYLFSGLPALGLLWGLAEGSPLPFRYYDALLIGLSFVYVAVGRARQEKYRSGLLATSRWPALQPAYAVGYLLVLTAVIWPVVDQVSRPAVLYGAAGVALVSAWWSGRALWTGLASVFLVPAVLLTLNQVAGPYTGYWSVALGGLGGLYLSGGIALRRAAAHAVVLFVATLALSVASLIWAASTGDLAVLSLALPVAIWVYAALAALAHAGRDIAVARVLAYVPHRIARGPEAEQAASRWGSILFMALAAALAPAWTTILRAWADIPEQWAGVDFVVLAAVFSFIGYRLTLHAARLHARVIFGVGALLFLAAPMYNAASTGSTWVLAGILYAEAALVALSAQTLRQRWLYYVAAALVVVPFVITLDVAGLSTTGWAIPWAVLAAAYFAGAFALKRRPDVATPMFGMAYVLTLVALAWTTQDSSGATARWTLPLVSAIYGTSAVLLHRRSHPGLHRPVQRAVDVVSEGELAGRTHLAGALGFAVGAAVLTPLWVALLLLWQGVEGAVHAYNPLGWAFVFALLAHFALRRYAALYRIAFLAFGGILAVSAIGVGLGYGSQVAIMGLLYGATALSVSYWVLLRSEAPLYVAAVLLPVPFALTLDLAGVSVLFWGTPLMVLAVAYPGLGSLLAGRRQTAAADALHRVGLGLSVVALGWTVAWILTRWADATPDTAVLGERLFMSVGPFLGAAAYAVAGYRRADTRFGHLAAWVMAGALGIVLDIFPLSAGESAVAVALGAAAYVSGGAVLRARSQARDATDAERRRAGVLSWPLLVAGYGVAAISLGMATYGLVASQEATWVVYVAYMINLALLGCSAYWFRIPAFAAGAATLFLLPFTLLIYDVFGESSGLLAVPNAALAFGWAGLALGYLITGIATERTAPRYSRALPILGYLLLIGAVVASLGSAERQSVVFGVVVVTAGALAFLTHRRFTFDFVDSLSRAFAISREVTRRHAVLAFATVASLLAPLWSLEIAALFTREAATQGTILALGAPAYVLIGALVARRSLNLYSWPVYFAGFGMTVAAPLLTLSSHPLNVTALAVGSATYVLSAYIFRRSTWGHVSLYIAAGLAALTSARALSGFDLSREAYGLGLMAVASAYVATAVLAERWTGGVRLLRPTSWGLRLPVGPTMPLYVAGVLLSIPAVILGIPESSDSWPVSVGVFFTGAVAYGLAAFRFRFPVLLYPSVGLAAAGYSLGLALLSPDPDYVGLALLPGAVASLGVGWLLHRLVGHPGTRVSAGAVARYAGSASGTAWAMPFLLVGYGSSLAGVLVTLSLADQSLLLVSLLAATGICAVSLAVFRAWAWLYPLLLTAHLAFASFLTLPALGLSLPWIGILFLPASAVMMLLLGVATRGVRGNGFRALLAPWAIPFAVFGLLDTGTSIGLAAGADWAGLAVSASYAVLTAAAAHATGIRILPYACTAFITGTTIFASRMFELGWGDVAVVWAAQGFLMWWGGQAAGALSRLGRVKAGAQARLQIWQAPLRNAGLRLSWFALAFVVAMAFLGLIVPDRFGASQVHETTTVLGILGLLYLGMAFVARRAWFGYLAVALLLASWTIQLIDLEIPFAQAYAIPAGLYLLGIAFFERRRSPGRLPTFIEGAAVLILVVSSFWQSVAEDPAWPYAILLGAEGLLLVLWGAANHARLPFMAGIAAFAIDVLYQTTGLLSNLQGQLIGLIVGLLIVVLIAGIEWRRRQLIQLGREWKGRLSQWSW